MKKKLSTVFLEVFLLYFIFLLFFHSKECMELAAKGLLIWFQKMIPSLFPFMILSGFMIRSGLSVKFGKLLQPLNLIFHLPSQMLYVIFMGFLCGFPMGAKIIADMLEKEQITLKEGEYLLAFCNNIGPLYILGYVIPLFQWKNNLELITLMYGVPLLYGIFLRYFTKYKNIRSKNVLLKNYYSTDYLTHLSSSLTAAIEQITMLGGCMIFFNCLQIFPLILCSAFHNYIPKEILQSILCSLTEIGGGLSLLANLNKNISLIPISISLLTFGGMSCLFQTYLILKKTNLHIRPYLKHKLIQALLIYVIYFSIFSI